MKPLRLFPYLSVSTSGSILVNLGAGQAQFKFQAQGREGRCSNLFGSLVNREGHTPVGQPGKVVQWNEQTI